MTSCCSQRPLLSSAADDATALNEFSISGKPLGKSVQRFLLRENKGIGTRPVAASFRSNAACYTNRCPRQGKAMNTVRVKTTLESDGELHLTKLPCRCGDKVEAIVRVLEPASRSADEKREKARAAAVEQFLALARSSSFRSAAPYPTRDEFHERP